MEFTKMARKDITSARTSGQAMSYVPKRSDVSGGINASISRKVNNFPDQKRTINDSPTTMAKNQAALRKGK
jgi:hypothetical protein